MTAMDHDAHARAGLASAGGESCGGQVSLRLAARVPFDGGALLGFLAARAVAGLEDVAGGTYRRTLRLAHGDAIAEITPEDDGARVLLRLDDARDAPAAAARCRRLLDLDADPEAIAAVLGSDPLLAGGVAARPGLRVPGAVDAWELAARAVLGQQVSVAAARRLVERLVEQMGERLATPSGAVTHRFPAPAAVAVAPDDCFPMPLARADTLRRVATLADEGELDLEALAALRGVGPWTAGYLALRLGDPDVFLPTDAAVVRALRGRRDGAVLAEAWRPWRSYAVLHLWALA
jgi:AraC family transcriptional regulator of adaptative response / DNA-3-methyladenine glycosylase II